MANPAEQRIDRLEEAHIRLTEEVALTSRAVRDLKNEMSEFKNEMSEFKEESRRERREFNRELGNIARSQGRLVEDIVAPSVPRLLKGLLGLRAEDNLEAFAVRSERAHPERSGEHTEVDVLAAHADVLLLVEVKGKLTAEQIADFASGLPQRKDFFPEHATRAVIGAVASVFVPESLVVQAERLGLLVLAAGDDLLSIQNSPGFVPHRF